MVSFRHPWDARAAATTLRKTGMYEASANIMWLNPFPVDEDSRQIAGDRPQWKSLIEAVDKFMTLDASQTKSLAPTQGPLGKVARLIFPLTIPARCDDAADGSNIHVLGHFEVVFGHTYVWAFYIGMFKAMQAQNVELVAALWQMALTTTVHLRSGQTKTQLALWSIQKSEEIHKIEADLSDSFPAFAQKCLHVLDIVPRRHRGAHDDDDDAAGDGMTSRKVVALLKGLTFRSHLVNQTMANTVMMFRTHVSPISMTLFADIERVHGRDVLSMHYAKIRSLISNCMEGNKVTGLKTYKLVEAALDAVNFDLRQKPTMKDVSLAYLDGAKEKRRQHATTGFVVKAIARYAFVRHFRLDVKDFGEKAGKAAESIMKDFDFLLQAAKTFSSFSEAFCPHGGSDSMTPQEHLADFKEKNIETKLGRSAVDLVYDVYTGNYDDELVAQIKPEGDWTKTILDWRACDIAAWKDIVQQMSLSGSFLIDHSQQIIPPRRSLSRALSNASDHAKEDFHEKVCERKQIMKAAISNRCKFVNFGVPKVWKEKELKTFFETSSAAKNAHEWSGGKATESHRVFLFAADLVHEQDEKPWSQPPAWISLGDEIVKFMKAYRGSADILVFSDGRSTEKCMPALVKHHHSNRHKAHFTITFGTSTRLGRRIAFGSDNVEQLFLSLPVCRLRFAVKERQDSVGGASGETTTHDLSYSGVKPMSWLSMTRVSDEAKKRILGMQKVAKPSKGMFDTSLGQPLFWAERKPMEFWLSLFRNLDAKMIIDCTPGSGTAAKAALEAGIPYFGMAKNDHHASFLCNVANVQALKMMRKEGSVLFQHQSMAECISAHYADLLATESDLDTAKDTQPDDIDVSDLF